MTEYIAHRINTVKELKELPQEYGVELDLRDSLDGRIYIQHNPFEPGEDFEEYLKEYHHGMMILNVKSERIELKILELLPKFDVRSYFFLDSSFPMIYLLSQQGEKNIALRLSEYEGIDTIRNMSGKIKWVWVDCFTRLPIDNVSSQELKELGYNICLVSPELQGHNSSLQNFIENVIKEGILYDAVCTKTKNIMTWKQGGMATDVG